VPTIVVKVKQDGKEQGEWDGEENIPNVNIPEMNQPSTVSRGKEGFGCR
jgi:hypothetical protein